MNVTPAPHLDDFPPPFGDLFEKSTNPTGRSPFYDLESHFWARDQHRELMKVAAGWWALAWFCAPYSEEKAIRLGEKARVYEARAERLVFSEWAISASTSFVAMGVVVAVLSSFICRAVKV